MGASPRCHGGDRWCSWTRAFCAGITGPTGAPKPDTRGHARGASYDAHVAGIIRLVHPAPALTVVALSAALGAIVAAQAGAQPFSPRWALTTLAVAGSQILTGALNDWADRERDAVVQPTKPIPSGAVPPRVALWVVAFGALLQLTASAPLGWVTLALGAAASASAVTYDLWLSRTPFSVVPYLVSFGILPLWVAAGVGVPLDRVAAASLLVGPFAAAAHLANTLRDFDADERMGSRNLAQVLGRGATRTVAVTLAIAVGLRVGGVLVLGGQAPPPAIAMGALGLAALVPGVASVRWLWPGMLVAAGCWTVAWALATG
jgi:4-hydroxybenzoate polyprenyltransferase